MGHDDMSWLQMGHSTQLAQQVLWMVYRAVTL
jgi:hypothetical protein